MKRTGRPFDFLFINNMFSFRPNGGYSVILRLAELLSKMNYYVGIVFLKNAHMRLYEILKDERLLSYLKQVSAADYFRNLFYNSISLRFLLYLAKAKSPLLKPLVGTLDPDFSAKFDLSRIRIFVSEGDLLRRLQAKRYIATSWESAIILHNTMPNSRWKYFFSLHDEDDPTYSGELNDIARKAYLIPMKKIVINNHMVRRFIAQSPIKVTVGPHISSTAVSPIQNRDRMVLFPLRAATYKGANYAIEAASMISKNIPGARLVLFGDFHGNVPSFINHLGYVNDRTLTELYSIASVFMLTSTVEGFALPVAEAMSFGCVPVASRCIGPEEIITNGYDGFLVPVGDSLQMAEKVSYLLLNDTIRREMAMNAVRTSKKYSWQRTVEEFVSGILAYEQAQL